MKVELSELDFPIIKQIGEEADKLCLPCYVVGGWVRDAFLHRPSKDIDCLVVGSGIELANRVQKLLGRGASLSVFKTFGTAQVSYRGMEIEFVGARKESYHQESRNPTVESGTLEDDLQRRDFTINALAICINRNGFGEFVDMFSGIRDLTDCVIRTPLNPDLTFSDDPLRMMRAIRFATQLLGFNIELETLAAIRRNADRIFIITKERIADELNKIMLSPEPSVGWKLLDDTGLLKRIFPDLYNLKGVEIKEGRGHKDVFLHTLQVLDNVSKLKKVDTKLNKKETDDILWLRWAALLHDIGKPQCKEWDDHIGWTFHNHNYIGSKMVERIFRQLKLPLNEKMLYVKKLVDLHMRPINLVEDGVTDSAIRRLLCEAGDDIDDLLLLCHADITSRNEEKVQRYHANFALVKKKMVELEERDRVRNFQPPIRGDEIMQLLNLPPSPIIGKLKTAIKDAILDGIIPNEYEKAKQYLYDIIEREGFQINDISK